MVEIVYSEAAFMKKTSGLAVASLVLGILAIILILAMWLLQPSFTYLSGMLASIFAVLGTFLGAVAIRKTGNNSNLRGRRIAIAGLCLGIIELVAMISIIVGVTIATRKFYNL
jgi:uncharacterized membrane protein